MFTPAATPFPVSWTPAVTPWPLSVFTDVLQPPRAARSRMAPRVENRMFRISFSSDWGEESSVLIRSRPKESRTKLTGQLAAIDFATLVYRYFFDKKNPLWDLPSTEARPAVLEQIGLEHSLSRHDARSHFFIAQD